MPYLGNVSSNNVTLGVGTLDSLTTGNNNIAIGNNAMLTMVEGTHNIGIGISAFIASGGDQNVGIGTQVFPGSTGEDNVGIGYLAGSGNQGISNRNICIGAQALSNSSRGDGTEDNICIGYKAGAELKASLYNIVIGQEALLECRSGTYNIAIGRQAMKNKILFPCLNIVIGDQAGLNIDSASNILIGNLAGQDALGDGNICVGTSAGSALSSNTEDNNILIASAGVAADNGAIRVGTSGTHSTCFIQGISGIPGGTPEMITIGTGGQLGKQAIIGVDVGLETGVTATSDGESIHDTCVDGAGFAGVKLFNFNYETGTLSDKEVSAGIVITTDENDATGGRISSFTAMSTTTGSTTQVTGLECGLGIKPVFQRSSTFVDPEDVIDSVEGDITSNVTNLGVNTENIFVANGSSIRITGSSSPQQFTHIEVILTTNASASVLPLFEYSDSVTPTYTAFSPIDGTNGFQKSGVIMWSLSDIPLWNSHPAGESGDYTIRITRQNSDTITTTPVVDYIQISDVTTNEYQWDENGIITIASHTITQNTANNTWYGYTALDSIASGGTQNTALGENVLTTITTGDNNTAIGYNSGSSLGATDNDNICIGNVGTSGDAGEIRIGTSGTINKCFIAGITGVTPDVASPSTVVIDTAGQLGVAASGAVTTVTKQWYPDDFLDTGTSEWGNGGSGFMSIGDDSDFNALRVASVDNSTNSFGISVFLPTGTTKIKCELTYRKFNSSDTDDIKFDMYVLPLTTGVDPSTFTSPGSWDTDSPLLIDDQTVANNSVLRRATTTYTMGSGSSVTLNAVAGVLNYLEIVRVTGGGTTSDDLYIYDFLLFGEE